MRKLNQPFRSKLTLLVLIVAVTFTSFSQTKNFIDKPYLETSATVDSLVQPDKIYLSIIISEKDTRGRVSVEELENKMEAKLKSLSIDIDKQLSLADLGSNFRRYFARKTDIQKSKSYRLLVYDGLTAGNAIVGLESVGISNVQLEKTEYSGIEELKIILRRKAILKAKQQAQTMIEPLDQKLGHALFISDSNTNNVTNTLQGKVRGLGIYGASAGEILNRPIKIEFKKIKVESTVNINFAIE